nr:MAG TPA: hypothetical protein [Caudoviricetes sp.]
MYNFYVLDGKKLIDYKPKREHYARALERITDANGGYDLERLWQERPDQFKQILYLSIKFIEHVFDNNSDCSQQETQSWFFIVEFINQMHRLNGGRDIFVEFMEEQGISIPTYHKEGNYLVNNETGERYKVQKPKRRLRKLFSVVSNK